MVEGFAQLQPDIQNQLEQDQGGSWLDKARRQAEGIGKQIGQKAKEQIGDKGVEDIVGGIAGKMIAPQVGALELGGNLIGGMVAKKQAQALLEDPKELAVRMKGAFDDLDDNKNGFVHNDELKAASSGLGLLSGNRGLVPIMRSGYTILGNLDQSHKDNGISRLAVDRFALLQDPTAMGKDIADKSFSSGLHWGLGTGIVGSLGVGLKSIARGAEGLSFVRPSMWKFGAVAVGAVAIGMLAKHFSGNSLESSYAEDKKQTDDMLEAMRKSL